MARRFAFLAVLVLLAPADARAQAHYLDAPFYVIRDATVTMPPPVVCPGNDNPFAQETEGLITTRIDGERAEFAPGAPALRPNPALIRIAEQRSCDMAHGAAFSHLDAQGRFIAGALVRESLGPRGLVGENIMETDGTRAFGAKEFAEAAVEDWSKSPEHRANILNPGFDATGVGVAKVGHEAVATQIFHGSIRKRDGGDP